MSGPRMIKSPESRKRIICKKTMVSKKIDDHEHNCMGEEDHGEDHFCKRCHRWWGKRGE